MPVLSEVFYIPFDLNYCVVDYKSTSFSVNIDGRVGAVV